GSWMRGCAVSTICGCARPDRPACPTTIWDSRTFSTRSRSAPARDRFPRSREGYTGARTTGENEKIAPDTRRIEPGRRRGEHMRPCDDRPCPPLGCCGRPYALALVLALGAAAPRLPLRA